MRLTIMLSVLMIITFIYSFFFVLDTKSFLDYYGFSGNAFMDRPYIIITSIFLHGGLDHLLSNIFVLLFFGIALEKEIGPIKMLMLFILGAFAGDAFSLLIYSPDTVSIGASAGIFALIGAGMLIKPLDLSFYPLVVPVPLLFVGIGYAIYNIYGFLFIHESNISFIGHFGGLFVGLFYGFKTKGVKKGIKILLFGLFIMFLCALLYLIITHSAIS